MTIYADVYFIINLSMDALCLFLCALILRRRIKPLRLVLAASLGAAYSIAALFFPRSSHSHSFLYVLTALPCALLLCLIVFGRRPKALFSSCAVFIGISFLLGGSMTALLSSLGLSFYNNAPVNGGSSPPSALRFSIAAAAALFSAAFTYFISRIIKSRARTVSISVTFGSQTLVCDALVDTGNTLRDPIGGASVVFLVRSEFEKLFPEAGEDTENNSIRADLLPLPLKKRVRFIPCRSEGAERLLLAFIPDSLTVEGAERRACVACGSASGYGERSCRALISDSIAN